MNPDEKKLYEFINILKNLTPIVTEEIFLKVFEFFEKYGFEAIKDMAGLMEAIHKENKND